jgi:hypothetical protein
MRMGFTLRRGWQSEFSNTIMFWSKFYPAPGTFLLSPKNGEGTKNSEVYASLCDA